MLALRGFASLWSRIYFRISVRYAQSNSACIRQPPWLTSISVLDICHLFHLVRLQGANLGDENLAHSVGGCPWRAADPNAGVLALLADLDLVCSTAGCSRALQLDWPRNSCDVSRLGGGMGADESISVPRSVLARHLGWHAAGQFTPLSIAPLILGSMTLSI